MVDQTKANSVEPASPAQHVLVDHRIRKEVDDGGRSDAEHTQFYFVAESIEAAVSGPEPPADSVFEVQAKSFRDLPTEQTK
jgi:hypothetical protein